MPLRFLVMGCGAVGGIVAAHLLECGQDVAVYSSNAAIAEAVGARGFQLRGEGTARAVPARVARQVPPGPFDVVVLATQPGHVVAAAQSALASLAPDGVMLCLQNGLCEERVARVAGPARTVGAVVAWGAAMPEPGLYDRTAAGGFTLGRLDGSSDARLEEIGRVLECIGPTEITANLAAVDFLNGEVVERGRKHGLPTPINARVRSLVWDVASHKRTPGLDLLRELGTS
jgi:2-dehydropantoate 2-reductase